MQVGWSVGCFNIFRGFIGTYHAGLIGISSDSFQIPAVTRADRLPPDIIITFSNTPDMASAFLRE